MNILVVMIPLSILLLIGAGIAFFWAVDHHQFDDMDTPRLLPLLDNTEPPAPISLVKLPAPELLSASLPKPLPKPLSEPLPELLSEPSSSSSSAPKP